MSDTDRSITLETAHRLSARGWRVIPVHGVGPDGLTCSCKDGRRCTSVGKHPIDAAWQNTPKLSGADLEEIFARYKRGNLGVATGAPSGFWVLDIDPEHGGTESLKALIAEHGAPPETYTVRTGGKGWQFYFAMPDFDVRNSVNVKGHQGIDVRGTGGQVVVPPSVSGKGVYTVAKDVPIVAAPDWLLDIIRKDEPTGPTTYSTDLPDRSDLGEAERKRLDRYADSGVRANLARLDELKVGMGPGYTGPAWNHTVFEVSCGLIEIANSPWNDITLDTAYSLVMSNAPRDAGFDDATITKTFESARQKVGDKARPVPPPPPPREPDFMDAPGIKQDPRLSDPTAASGAHAQPAGQSGAPGGTSSLRPHDFIDPRDGLLTGALAVAVEQMGPIAVGVDGAFWSYADGVWSSDPKVVRNRVSQRLGNLFRGSHATNVEEFVSYRVPRIEGKPVPEWINFENGLLDWKTLTLHPHTPEVMSTIQLPLAWDPDATCPRFEQFLEESFTQDYIDLAWEVMGYAMYSGNPLQVAMMFIGNGQNGKSTLIHVIEDMLGGRRNVSSETLSRLSANTFASSGLFGKIANIAGDIDATYQESTALFKSISASDTIAAERKHRDAFEFKPWAVNIFSANKIPGSADVSEGYLRRWIVLQFPNKPKNPDPDLRRKLAAELPGIAARAVPALQRVLERRAFDIKGDAAHGKEEFAEAIDQVRQWISDATIEAPEHSENRTNLYTAYCRWAGANGMGQLKSGEFYHRLESIGFQAAKRHGNRVFIGLMPANIAEQQKALGIDDESDFFEGVS